MNKELKNKLVHIRLNSGDMLAAKLDDVSETSYTLNDPKLIVLAQGNSVSFYDYNPFGKNKTIEISNNMVLFVDELSDEMSNHYKEVTSKILQPKKSSIIT